jgi:galactonate dehydratase
MVMVDGHGRFSVGTASWLAHRLSEHDVYWFEEPVDPENYAALGQVARPGGLRIAAGERCYSRYQVPLLMSEGRPHVLQPDPIQVGGLLEAKKIAVLANSAYLPVSFHSPFGPIATAAVLQLNAATTNVVCQESFSEFDVAWRSDLITNCPMPIGGSYRVSDLPGLGGIELNESVVRDHPFQERAVQSMWAVNGSMNAGAGVRPLADGQSGRTSGERTAGTDGTERPVPVKGKTRNVPELVEDASHGDATKS